MFILTTISFDFLEHVKRETEASKELQALKQELLNRPDENLEITYIDGIFFHHNRVLLSSQFFLKPSLLAEFHSSPLGGHAGMSKTLRRLNPTLPGKELIRTISPNVPFVK